METTLCYIERDDAYLMLLRNKKPDDINAGKWIGVGGKIQDGESIEECLVREVEEETGIVLRDYRKHGLVYFRYGDDVHETMHLFTAHLPDDAPAELPDCAEGTLAWIPKSEVLDVELWEGDKVFLRMLLDGDRGFSLALDYDEEGNLIDVRDVTPER